MPAGFQVTPDGGKERCYDGRMSATAADLCVHAPTAQPLRTSAEESQDVASGRNKDLLQVVTALRNVTLTAAVAMLLHRLFRAFQRQQDIRAAVRRADAVDPVVLADAAVRRIQ